MPRPFRNIATSPTSPATRSAAVTPSDTTVVDAKFVQVTSVADGNVLVIQAAEDADDTWITFTGVPVGFIPMFNVKRVGASTTCDVIAAVN